MRRTLLIALVAVICALLLAQPGNVSAFVSPVPAGGVPTEHAEFYRWCTRMCGVDAPGNPGCLRYCRRTAMEECRVAHGDNCAALYGEPRPTRCAPVTAGCIRKAR